jgi:hypothetical protein
MIAEQRRKDKQLEDLEKSLQAQLQTQRNKQKILETIWNNISEKNQLYNNNNHDDEEADDKNTTNIKLSKISWTCQRNDVPPEEEAAPVTTAETFVLADGKNNKFAQDMSAEEIVRLPYINLLSGEELRRRLSS